MTENSNAVEPQKTIKLTKGYETFVDPQDSDLAALKWCVSASPNRKPVYAYRAVTGDNKRKEYLGRVILARKLRDEGKLGKDDELPLGMTCTYLDKNSLNNRRDNIAPKVKNIISKDKL
jgi:hypothetical protein